MSISTKHIKRKLFETLRADDYTPLRAHELGEAIGLHKREQRAYRTLLRNLESEGQIVRLRRHLIALPDVEDEVTGTLSLHLQGFGFVVRDEDSEAPDIFIPRSALKGARHGDKVLVAVREEAERGPDGRVVKVLERGVTETVGTLLRRGKEWIVLPDDPRVSRAIRVRKFVGDWKPQKQHKVFFELHESTRKGAAPTAIVREDLGAAGASGVDMLSIMRRHGLSQEFPAKVTKEVAKVRAGATEKEIARRRDCRKWLAYTIDPPDAKDHDDALSIRTLRNGNVELGVHIADVAHFVKPGTAVDEEAARRGNSAYLVDRVVPMLPNKLTTDLCSLVPHQDRLTHTVVVELTPRGKVVGHEAFLSVIHSKAKFSYEQVQAFFDDGKTKGINKKAQASLLALRDITRALRKARMGDGAIGFHVPEVRCELRKDGKIKRIVKRMPIEAYGLVEECMLLANKVVAETFVASDRAGIFRVHEEPTEEQWAEIATGLAALGIDEIPETKADLTRIVDEQPEGLKYPTVLAILRNMQRAVYTAELDGHFGLGFHAYSHFTSPIRRYPDLVAHRVLRTIEHKQKPAYKKSEIEELAAACSATERSAEEAEIESVQTKLIAHYEQLLWKGEASVYPAHIVAFKPRGIICELDESLFKGLLPFPALPGDYYVLDEGRTKATGKRTRNTYRLGQRVEVMITRVDTVARQMEFGVAE